MKLRRNLLPVKVIGQNSVLLFILCNAGIINLCNVNAGESQSKIGKVDQGKTTTQLGTQVIRTSPENKLLTIFRGPLNSIPKIMDVIILMPKPMKD